MVRTYKRKSERGACGDDVLKEALAALENQPMKAVSRRFGIPARTLRRHRDKKVATVGSLSLGPRQPVLSADVERTLREHIAYMEKCLYGLTTVDVRRLAYDLAVKLGLAHTFNAETKMAGRDWLHGFFKRHPDLAIRQPQGTNIARAVGFNRPKVQLSTAGPPSSTAGPPPSTAGPTPPTAGPPTTASAGVSTVKELIKQLSPLPKISRPRARSRIAECATVLTSTPHKNKLAMQQAKKERIPKLKKKSLATGVKRHTAKKRRVSSSSEEEEWPCIICGEPFKDSRSREVWVQCQLCKKWAHEDCTAGQAFFTCPNCESESD